MTTPSLARQVLLLYRGEGHVRFALPAVLCSEAVLQQLRKCLLQLDGVYRVDCYPAQCKLSIRYQHAVCPLIQVAQRLRDTIVDTETAGLSRPVAAASTPVAAPTGGSARHRARSAAQWLKTQGQHWQRRAHDWRAKAIGFKHYALAKAGTDRRLAKGLDERTVVNFLNDIAAFYLVKIHWDLITKRWIKTPFTHRYEWMTMFYLVFLLVRYRKSVLKK